MYLSLARGRRGAVGRGHRDVDRAGPRRGDDRERGAGAVTLIVLPAVVPKSTAVAPVKLVPLTVTVLVPPWGPLVGLTPVTVGAAVVGVLVTGAGRRGAVGRGHRDVDRAGPRRGDDGQGGGGDPR